MINFTTKEKIFLTAAVALLIALGVAFSYKIKVDQNYHKALYANDSITQTLKSYYDKNGKLQTQVEVLQVDKTLYTQANQAVMDSYAKSLGVNKNDINNILKTAFKDTGKIHSHIDTVYVLSKDKKDPAKQDTDVNYNVNYKDTWLTLNGTIDNGEFDASYSMNDSLTFITFQKPQGFLGLGKKKTYLNVNATNPNVSFYNLRNVELTNIKDKKWSIGPSLQYNLFSNKVDVGVSLQYGLFKF